MSTHSRGYLRTNLGFKFCRKAKKLLLTPDCEQYEHLTEEKWMVTLFLNESMLKRSWFSNMIFLQRAGVCDSSMHFIDNQTLHNPVLGPNNQFLCIETIPDSVMWPQSSVLLWRILTALCCISTNRIFKNVTVFYNSIKSSAIHYIL